MRDEARVVRVTYCRRAARSILKDAAPKKKIRSGVSKSKRDCEESVLKEWGAGSNRMRDPVPDLLKKA